MDREWNVREVEKVRLDSTCQHLRPQAFMLRRIKDEEAMLKRELEKDYAQYMKDVPYRLLPGIW